MGGGSWWGVTLTGISWGAFALSLGLGCSLPVGRCLLMLWFGPHRTRISYIAFLASSDYKLVFQRDWYLTFIGPPDLTYLSSTAASRKGAGSPQ